MISRDFTMKIQQVEIAKNIDEINAQAVELHKRFSIFIDRFNDIDSNLNRLNKRLNAAVGSAQSEEIDVNDQIDEMVRMIQAE